MNTNINIITEEEINKAIAVMCDSFKYSDCYADVENDMKPFSNIFADKNNIYKLLVKATEKFIIDNVKMFIKYNDITYIPMYVTAAYLDLYEQGVEEEPFYMDRKSDKTPVADFMLYIISITDHDSVDNYGNNLFQYMIYTHGLPRLITNSIMLYCEREKRLLNKNNNGDSSLEFIFTDRNISGAAMRNIGIYIPHNNVLYNRDCELYEYSLHYNTDHCYNCEVYYSERYETDVCSRHDDMVECDNCIDHAGTDRIIKSLLAEYHEKFPDGDKDHDIVISNYKKALNETYKLSLNNISEKLKSIDKDIVEEDIASCVTKLIDDLNKTVDSILKI